VRLLCRLSKPCALVYKPPIFASSVCVSPRCGWLFIVVAGKIDQTWLCNRKLVMSNHPSSTGSSSVHPSLLSPPTSTPFCHQPSIQSTQIRLVTPPPNASIPTSTPISNKTGNHSYASETHDRDSANYRLAQETSGYFLGAMPPPKFLDMFFSICQDTPECPNSKRAFTSILSAGKEVDMYTPFVSRVLCFCTYCALPTFIR